MLNKDTNKYEGYIYCITNTLNNKKYIGQTIQRPSHRWSHHKCANNRKHVDTYIDRAIAKYGENNFKFAVIETIIKNSQDKLSIALDKAEIKYISNYKSLWSENGYNVSSGGQNYGNKRVSTKNKIDIYDINGKFICTTSSMTEAAEFVGCDTQMVSRVCRGISNSYNKKYVFRKHLEPFDKYDTSIYFKGEKKVDVFDNNWNYLETLPSITATAKKYGTQSGSLSFVVDRCNGKAKKPYKKMYYFKYAS